MPPEKRGSYLNPDLLKEIRGRSEYGAKNLEELLDRHKPPELKPYTPPPHQYDALGAAIGMSGFEVNQFHLAALALMAKDPEGSGIVLAAYKRFLMAAKLVCNDAVQRVMEENRSQQQQKAARDSKYQGKLKEWQAQTKKITDSWTEVRSTAKTRWRRLMKSLEKLIGDNPSIHTMHEDDVVLLRIIEDAGRARIVNGEVQDINWTFLQEDISIEEIDVMIRRLESRIAEGGSWKKPQVRKLDELTSSKA